MASGMPGVSRWHTAMVASGVTSLGGETSASRGDDQIYRFPVTPLP